MIKTIRTYEIPEKEKSERKQWLLRKWGRVRQRRRFVNEIAKKRGVNQMRMQ